MISPNFKTGFTQKLANKIQWLFHDFFMTTFKNFPWLGNAENPSFLGHIFARWQGEFSQFSNSMISWDQKLKFHDFSMTWAIFQKIHDFSRPRKYICKFHDFSWPYEPCKNTLFLNDAIILKTVVVVYIKTKTFITVSTTKNAAQTQFLITQTHAELELQLSMKVSWSVLLLIWWLLKEPLYW